MPDGTRKRRHSSIAAKRRWYAAYRAERFSRRFWGCAQFDSTTDGLLSLANAFGAKGLGMTGVNLLPRPDFSIYWNSLIDTRREPSLVA
jgi:hypothetical protein